ncbi:MAG: hypothetical protein ABEI96_06835 [Haloarculaceae archaeon]
MAGSRPAANEDDDIEFGVVIFDDNRTRGELYALWLDRLHCTLATSTDEVLETLGDEHLVVCLSARLERETDVVTAVRKRVPHAQVLVLVTRDMPLVTIEWDCDETLREPIDRSTFRETVRKLARRGLYSLKVNQFYKLNAALVSAGRRAGDDRDSDRDSMRATIERLEAEIKSLAARMDGSDFDAMLTAVRSRNRYLYEPSAETTPSHNSKYHPDDCPNCGLTWGVAHGSPLGLGYRRIGAFVWQCRRCEHVLKLSAGEYDKIL